MTGIAVRGLQEFAGCVHDTEPTSPQTGVTKQE